VPCTLNTWTFRLLDVGWEGILGFVVEIWWIWGRTDISGRTKGGN